MSILYNRKQQRRSRVPARAMPAFRKRLPSSLQSSISLMHHSNLDAIASKTASESALWDWTAAVTMWMFIAERLGIGEPEMQTQIDLVEKLIDRFAATSRVHLDADEYEMVKTGVVVMDLLAAEVDLPTVVWAAECSNKTVHQRVSAL